MMFYWCIMTDEQINQIRKWQLQNLPEDIEGTCFSDTGMNMEETKVLKAIFVLDVIGGLYSIVSIMARCFLLAINKKLT